MAKDARRRVLDRDVGRQLVDQWHFYTARRAAVARSASSALEYSVDRGSGRLTAVGFIHQVVRAFDLLGVPLAPARSTNACL